MLPLHQGVEPILSIYYLLSWATQTWTEDLYIISVAL